MKKKKFVLNREVLRSLGSDALTGVRGGEAPSFGATCGPNASCGETMCGTGDTQQCGATAVCPSDACTDGCQSGYCR